MKPKHIIIISNQVSRGIQLLKRGLQNRILGADSSGVDDLPDLGQVVDMPWNDQALVDTGVVEAVEHRVEATRLATGCALQ